MSEPAHSTPPRTSVCRVCGGTTTEFFDLGQQPLSDAFRDPADTSTEFSFQLAVGRCSSCTLVQLIEEVPREHMFHEDYPYLSSKSTTMQEHFQRTAHTFLRTELVGPDPFVVEIGCNDGVMLRTIGTAGVRHLGVEPSGGVAEIARENGVHVDTDFFDESTATHIRKRHGRADVIYAANTFCHIPYIESIFTGIDALLGPEGVFVFEDPYLGDILTQTSFDQIYDEHFFLFSVHSVTAMAKRFGFELVDVQRLPVHGGEIRYTLARAGTRPSTPAVEQLRTEEERRELTHPQTLNAFADNARQIRDDLTSLLGELRSANNHIVAYGATAKSATVTNFCGIDTDLVSYVCDNTPTKQGRLTPGAHLPVRPATDFASPYPDYALLFAWNHASEIMAKEQEFRDRGGKWILYIPEVHVV